MISKSTFIVFVLYSFVLLTSTQEFERINVPKASMAARSDKIDLYNLANTIFNSQRSLGNLCDRCRKLEYISFRMGNRYLTA